MPIQCRLVCRIRAGGPSERVARPGPNSAKSRNYLVKVWSWLSMLWPDALYCDCGSPLGLAAEDNQFCWAYTGKQSLPNRPGSENSFTNLRLVTARITDQPEGESFARSSNSRNFAKQDVLQDQ